MKYELMTIIRPLEERVVEETINKVVDLVNETGSLIKIDKFGRKRLAYEIKDETEGIYVSITFDSEFPKVTKLDRKLHQIEAVIRHIIVWKGGEILPDSTKNNKGQVHER